MKNLKFGVWDWICIAFTALIVFNWHGLVQRVTQAGGEIAETGSVQGKKQGGSFWRRLGQSIISNFPGGNIINTIWDEIWP